MISIKEKGINKKKLLNFKIFISSFKNFISYIINYEAAQKKNLSKLALFLKIFIFWKFFIALWNKLIKCSPLKIFTLKFNKGSKFLFMWLLRLSLKGMLLKKNKKQQKFLKGYSLFFKRTYLIDLHLYWVLYFYSSVAFNFYKISFIAWLEFFSLLNNGFETVKFLLKLKNLYKLKDLYKNLTYFNDFSFKYVHFAHFCDLSNFFASIQSNVLLILSLQNEQFKKKLDYFGSIFDNTFGGPKRLYINKLKKYTPFFFTIHYEHVTRWIFGRKKRRIYPKRGLAISI